jgi:hypothetical protein
MVLTDSHLLRDYLLKRNSKSQTALQHSVANENVEIYNYLKKIYEDIFSESEMLKILQNKKVKNDESTERIIENILTNSLREHLDSYFEYLERKI